MKFLISSLATFLLLISNAQAEVFSINKIVMGECKEIVGRDGQYGEFGSKSRGLSLGTTAASVMLALQELHLIDFRKYDYSKNRSIYTICKHALGEINRLESSLLAAGKLRSDIAKYIDNEISFIRLIDEEIKRVVQNHGLIVFVALDEPQ